MPAGLELMKQARWMRRVLKALNAEEWADVVSFTVNNLDEEIPAWVESSEAVARFFEQSVAKCQAVDVVDASMQLLRVQIEQREIIELTKALQRARDLSARLSTLSGYSGLGALHEVIHEAEILHAELKRKWQAIENAKARLSGAIAAQDATDLSSAISCASTVVTELDPTDSTFSTELTVLRKLTDEARVLVSRLAALQSELRAAISAGEVEAIDRILSTAGWVTNKRITELQTARLLRQEVAAANEALDSALSSGQAANWNVHLIETTPLHDAIAFASSVSVIAPSLALKIEGAQQILELRTAIHAKDFVRARKLLDGYERRTDLDELAKVFRLVEHQGKARRDAELLIASLKAADARGLKSEEKEEKLKLVAQRLRGLQRLMHEIGHRAFLYLPVDYPSLRKEIRKAEERVALVLGADYVKMDFSALPEASADMSADEKRTAAAAEKRRITFDATASGAGVVSAAAVDSSSPPGDTNLHGQQAAEGLETERNRAQSRHDIEEVGFHVGAVVLHDERGRGVVKDVNWGDKRGKPIYVHFDNGEVHHYSLDSALSKLHILLERLSTPFSRQESEEVRRDLFRQHSELPTRSSTASGAMSRTASAPMMGHFGPVAEHASPEQSPEGLVQRGQIGFASHLLNQNKQRRRSSLLTDLTTHARPRFSEEAVEDVLEAQDE